MKYYFFVFLLIKLTLEAYSLVFVHIGRKIPDYVPIALQQARLFNKECPIYFIGNERAMRACDTPFDKSIRCVSCESLTKSPNHQTFTALSKFNNTDQGFWTFTSERFFYLEELVEQYGLTDVFHLENDVMLYVNLEHLVPIFKEKYSGMIGATFDSDTRCIPGFMYISEITPLAKLTHLMATRAPEEKNDMEMLQEFKSAYHHTYIDNLPIIMPQYNLDFGLKNSLFGTTQHPEWYSQYFDDFNSIFDAAAIGQYLGGISPRNGSPEPGFINETCLFDPSRLTFEWKMDSEQRLVPYISYKNSQYPINNLHIHSKNLKYFFSGKSLRKADSPSRTPCLPFVSGDAFRAYCDYVFDEENNFLNPLFIQPNSTIFVKGDYLEKFFNQIHPYIPCKYILITHNSDDPAPGRFASLLEDEKILAWFAQNVDNNTHPKLHPIPIGIANRCWVHGKGSSIESVQSNPPPKKHRLYVNFAVATFPQERRVAYRHLRQLPSSYFSAPTPFETYLEELASCSFVASPRGNGLDTHRLWEALYVGSYPIVKSSSLDPLYADLPIVIVQDWSQVTEKFLDQKYEELKRKSFSIEKLYMDYWENLINSYKQ